MPKTKEGRDVILFYDRTPDSRVAAQAVSRQTLLDVEFIETDDDSRFHLPCLMYGLFSLYEGSPKIIKFFEDLERDKKGG